ncbi:two pore domain potassium channel family protein [Chitinophaga silvatica]|uniref:Two pore domain potassium channel family protein n=1 Tax=Chitinophaga silvatica TaxID=2282649 RepID=A0A3E1Y905_9BACT|nr:potassium channel family protein [Chitinophaga silvatica]RFS21885.1 two pore domain potassium channel family protein [Chitinophaga silvatica]
MKTATAAPANKHQGIYEALNILVLLLSIILVISISIDAFKNHSIIIRGVYLRIQLWVCLLFILVFVLKLILTNNKWRYLQTHLIFLIISIPYNYIFYHYHISFNPEITYLIRFIPLIRGAYALALIVNWISNNTITSLFTSYIILLVATVYFSSLIFFVLEQNTNPLLTNFGDALWWACMNVTTVGSNIIATTTTGKVLSVLLSALGLLMFPIFTVFLSNIMKNANKDKHNTTDLD